MKIVSLLPSATEIAYALGLGDQLEGVTDGCDHPPDARTKPVVSASRLALDGAGAADIDGAVREAVADGEPLYALDAERIGQIQPDLILTQDLCRVCAVPSGDVEGALETLGCRAEVLSLDPHTIDDVLDDIVAVGRRTGTESSAAEVVADLGARLAAVDEAVAGLSRRPTFPLEWLDPPFSGGHWVPEMVERAGATPVLCEAGTPSRPVPWDDVARARPEAIVFMPCGYDLDAAAAEARHLAEVRAVTASPAAAEGRVWVVDATSYFSRPGPRLVDGVELLASLFHPGAVPDPPPGRWSAVGL